MGVEVTGEVAGGRLGRSGCRWGTQWPGTARVVGSAGAEPARGQQPSEIPQPHAYSCQQPPKLLKGFCPVPFFNFGVVVCWLGSFFVCAAIAGGAV